MDLLKAVIFKTIIFIVILSFLLIPGHKKCKKVKNTPFYKQLATDLSTKSCLQFQGFLGLKLLNGCLVV